MLFLLYFECFSYTLRIKDSKKDPIIWFYLHNQRIVGNNTTQLKERRK